MLEEKEVVSPIYWAVLLDENGKSKLLTAFPPKHPNVYGEHMTIAFKPDDETNQMLTERLGEEVVLNVIGYAEDDNGQAVVVSGEPRINSGTPHITISCADGTKPFYSNKLLDNGYEPKSGVSLTGKISAFTKHGWI